MFNTRTIFATLILTILVASPCVADYVSTVTGTSGLVGYWRFEGDANSNVKGYTGTLIGNAYISAASGGAPLVGDPNGRALVLDGNTDAVLTNMQTQEPLYDAATFMMWVKVPSFPTSGRYTLMNKEIGGSDMNFWMEPTNNIVWCTSSYYKRLTGNPGGSFVAGTWHHLAATFDDAANTTAIYLDGSQLAINTSATDHPDSDQGTLVIGSYTEGSGYENSTNGSIDEVAVFDRALSSGEISAIYASRLDPIPEPSSLMLLACGLVGLLAYAWRKRK